MSENLRHDMNEARRRLDDAATEFNRVLAERGLNRHRAAVARELGIDKIKLHHFANGRMVLDEDETDKVIAWMTGGHT